MTIYIIKPSYEVDIETRYTESWRRAKAIANTMRKHVKSGSVNIYVVDNAGYIVRQPIDYVF